MVPLPLNAALGALPPRHRRPLAVIPVLTGKLELAATITVPPTTLAMPGVMTWKRQPICTCPVSPMSVALPLPFRSVKVGVKSLALIVPSALVSTSWQLIAAASAMIWLKYFVFRTASLATTVPSQAVGLLPAKLAAIRDMFWRLM